MASGVTQQRNADGSPAVSHPNFRPHLMQGWTPDFIPKLAQDALDAGLIDDFMPIAGDDALKMSRQLAQQEGIFTGITGGATLAGALEVCARAPEGSTVLCMLPDTGERYLSTPLFEDVPAEMTDEEMDISRSTPGYRFDRSQPSPQPAAPLPAASAEAVRFVEETVNDADNPVVMFALEWCEFSWSVRKMFAEFDIPYRSVDLDSVAYQENGWGGDIRAALRERIASPTIPQIFVGGGHIGGCTETFDAFNDGRLRALLAERGIDVRAADGVDAYSFLPTWLQPR
jgi:cysteine synthase A